MATERRCDKVGRAGGSASAGGSLGTIHLKIVVLVPCSLEAQEWARDRTAAHSRRQSPTGTGTI